MAKYYTKKKTVKSHSQTYYVKDNKGGKRPVRKRKEAYTRDQRYRKYNPILMEKALEQFEKRSERAKTLDRSKTAKKTSNEPTEEWAEKMNQMDIEGIDTYESVQKRYFEINFKENITSLNNMASEFGKVNDLLYDTAKEHLKEEQIKKLDERREELLNFRETFKKKEGPTSLYTFSDHKKGLYLSERENGSIEVVFDYNTYNGLRESEKKKWRSTARWDPINKVWNVYKNKKDDAFDVLYSHGLIPEKPKGIPTLREQYSRGKNSIVIEIDEKGAKVDGPSDKLKQLDSYYSYQMKGYKYSQAYKDGKWDGRIHILGLGQQTLPENLAYNILEEKDKIFSDSLMDIEILDFRKNVVRQKPYILRDIQLYDYQQEAVKKAVDEKAGLIAIATGGGKTEIASGIIAEYGEKNDTIFLVHTTALQDQVEQRLEKRLGKNVGVGGGVKHDIKDTSTGDINVVTIQSLHEAIKTRKEKKSLSEKQKELLEAYDNAELIIQDEAHHVKAKTFKEVFDESKTKHKYGLTATPYRDEKDEKEVFSRFGKKIVDISADDLIKKKKLVSPTIHIIDVPASKEARLIADSYRDGTRKYNAIRNTQIVNNDTRNNLIKQITGIQEKKGKTSLIFVDRIAHGNRLAKLLHAPFLNGQNQSEKSRAKNQKIINQLKQGKLKKIVATQQLFGEGFDLPAIDSLIIADAGGSSKVRTMQRAGRALRTKKGKKGTDIFDFNDKTQYLSDHASERVATYKENREFMVKQTPILHKTSQIHLAKPRDRPARRSLKKAELS